jgi:hypothetical protein
MSDSAIRAEKAIQSTNRMRNKKHTSVDSEKDAMLIQERRQQILVTAQCEGQI